MQARCYHHGSADTRGSKDKRRNEQCRLLQASGHRHIHRASGSAATGPTCRVRSSRARAIQVHFKLKWQAADDETRRTHEQQQHRLRRRAANADASYDITEGLRLVDPAGHSFKLYSDMIAIGDSLPGVVGLLALRCVELPGSQLAYRYWLAKHAVKGDFTFFKRVWSA